MKQIWHVTREDPVSLMTICIGSKIFICVMRVFLSTDMLCSGTKPVVALQPINPVEE